MIAPLESQLIDILAEIVLPPLKLHWLAQEVDQRSASFRNEVRADAVLEVCFTPLLPVQFAAEYKRQATPKMIDAAAREATQYARQSGLLPLVIVPYLSEELLLKLESQGVSGLDLCGNGIILVPGKFVVFRTGKPNRFTTSAPIKNVYRGTTSLVARAFLLRPTYSSISELMATIDLQNGTVSLSTVSKALQGLDDDQLISRQKSALRLLQPDKMLQYLEKNYVPPKTNALTSSTASVVGRVALAPSELQQALVEQAARTKTALAATGVSSAPRYTALALEEEVSVYCSDVNTLLKNLPFEETTRFPNLRLFQTNDPTVFFDPRHDEVGYPWASPVQAYLEMATSGDPRLKQSAGAVRETLLSSLMALTAEATLPENKE